MELYRQTPLIDSPTLSRILGCDVYLKLESLQPSGSFKNRGIGYFCQVQAKRGVEAFVSSSGGNAGLAAAYAARQLTIPITVVVPGSTPALMLERIRAEGATVIQQGADWQEADAVARALCKEKNTCYVSPFDHPLIWEGHASLIHEVAETGLRPDAVLLSVGGGGLLCGVVQGLHEVGWPEVPVYAAETVGAASLAAALKAGHVVELEKIETVARCLGARAVTKQAVEWAKRHTIHSKVVTDCAAVEACQRFAEDHRLLVEPACGAALSLIFGKDHDLMAHKQILVVVCGGAAVTPQLLEAWSKREAAL